MKFNLMIAAALAAAGSGCATATRGTTEDLTVQTEPPGAVVTTTKAYSCAATPCTMKVKRKDQFTVVLNKQGYKETHVDVITRMSGAGGMGLAGNVIIGGLIGVGVDAVSGATLDHYPNPVYVVLEPDDGNGGIVHHPAPGPAPAKPPSGPPVS